MYSDDTYSLDWFKRSVIDYHLQDNYDLTSRRSLDEIKRLTHEAWGRL